MHGACLDPAVSMPGSGPANAPPDDRFALLVEADHRIANHLALLAGYVRLKGADVDGQAAQPSREAVHALLDGVSAQIAAIARLHRALVSAPATGAVELGEHLHEVCACFATGLCKGAKIVEEYASDCAVRGDQVLALSQIVAEVVTNALKHAAGGAGPGAIFVRCRKNGAGEVRVEVTDSGCGFPGDFDPGRDGGLGFRLVRELGLRLRARTGFESTADGVRFSLTLPAPGPTSPKIQPPSG
jgi:two-component sensor histidine kinase